MELGNVVEFLENKTLLVTGATGFLAKIFMEKILRIQPNVKKLYLLLRASDINSANQRFRNEVIEKQLFRVAKEKWGENLNSIISEKIIVIPGDVGSEDLEIKDLSLIEELKKDLDFVHNFAAITKFYERYDVAFNTNTMGAKNVLLFAKGCLNLKLLVHVSTAYVCGESSELIKETPCRLGETLNGACGLKIDQENELISRKLNELMGEGASEATIREAMKNLGIARAREYGWPNSYVFTKAMGEMLVQHLKGNLPVLIMRPTIVTATLREPFPGWIEGIKTVDAFIVGYGKGNVKFYVADPATIVDMIPADMVVNAIIIAMVAHSKETSTNVYQLGSSSKNPIRCSDIKKYCVNYFTKKPYIGKDGKPIKVIEPTGFSNMDSFRKYIAIRYLPLLKSLKLANTICCNCFKDKYNIFSGRIEFVMRLVELYRPYLFFHGIFDDSNVDKLLIAAKENSVEFDTFFFDAKSIDWADYFMNIHIPGLINFVMK